MDWRPVVVAAVVVLAGCGALGGTAGDAGGPGTDATATLTPVPVPEVTETPVTLPPGVTGANVTDATALVDSHFEALAGRSYTLRVHVVVDGARSERHLRVETDTRYYRADRLADPWGNTTQFADDGTLYTRDQYRGTFRYSRFDSLDMHRSQTVQLSRAFLRVDRVRVAETRVDGQPAYELTGSYPTHPATESLRNVSLRAVVEPSGLIRALNVSYDRESDGATVVRSFAYSELDTTTVERPAWVTRQWNGTDTPG